MLQRAGLLPEGEVVRVREFAYAHKVTLVEVVIDRGHATEDELVKFLQSKLMIPEVEADLLGELERETLRRLPAATGKQGGKQRYRQHPANARRHRVHVAAVHRTSVSGCVARHCSMALWPVHTHRCCAPISEIDLDQ